MEAEAPEPRERLGAVIESQHPETLIALVLEFSQLRAAFAIGRALWFRYPLPEDWLAATNSPEFLELTDEFAQVVSDIRDTLHFGPLVSPETVQQAVAQHYERALAAVEDFAKQHDIDGVTLLEVLTNTAGRLSRERDELDELRAQVAALARRVEELGGGSARGA